MQKKTIKENVAKSEGFVQMTIISTTYTPFNSKDIKSQKIYHKSTRLNVLGWDFRDCCSSSEMKSEQHFLTVLTDWSLAFFIQLILYL